jgi:predicted N-acetyltransferase YhbS
VINMLDVTIRETGPDDLGAIRGVLRSAFGGDIEADLAEALIADPTAAPVHSLLAIVDERPVGHILFTRATLINTGMPVRCSLLAPLAVVADRQRQGIGRALIDEGIECLRAAETDLVFVLGHPGYYSRFGFAPAGLLGLQAPYPIPEEDADAWMVQDLRGGMTGVAMGEVRCAAALDRPEYWRE